jgi:hypothetical protein
MLEVRLGSFDSDLVPVSRHTRQLVVSRKVAFRLSASKNRNYFSWGIHLI